MPSRLRALPLLGVLALAALAPLATAPVAHAAGRSAATADPLPPAKHVWVVELENKSYDESFVNNSNTYLWSQLPSEGALLQQYYGTGHLSLDNYISEMSGQGTNLQTKLDCMAFTDVLPGTLVPATGAGGTADLNAGQTLGTGCVYPSTVQTLPDQLEANGLTWKGYMEDMGKDPTREQTTCGLPLTSAGVPVDPTSVTPQQDGTQAATAVDQYAARHNPFLYFHSIIDDPARCSAHLVPLVTLPGSTVPGIADDLASVATTPNFSFITPNLCNDAHDATCAGPSIAGDTQGGLAAADAWLKVYVPMIQASPAYQQDGVIIVTFDEGDTAEATSSNFCCNEPPSLNGVENGLTGNGGGQIGTVVISRYVKPGTVSTVGYNHYSMLRSLEDMFGITTGGTDGLGHLGYAAMPTGARATTDTTTSATSAFVPFGCDVFTAFCATAASASPSVAATSAAASTAPTAGATTPAARPVVSSPSLATTGGAPWALPAVLASIGAGLAATAVRRSRRQGASG